MFGRLNIVLAVLLVAVVMMAAMTDVDYSQPNLEFLPEMKRSPAWSAFEANPNFSNGRTLQAPPTGTIARGELPLYFAATKEDAVRAGEELINPYAVDTSEQKGDEQDTADEAETKNDPAAIAEQQKKQAAIAKRFQGSIRRGGDAYRVFCVCCHGAAGAGDGQVAKRGFPPPPSLLTGKSPKMKDGQLFHILTYGQGSMSPFAAQLTRDRRWDVINYVRSMQAKTPVPSAPANDAKQPVQQE